MYNTRCYCKILITLLFPLQFFEKYSKTKFHENLSRGCRVVSCGQTDGQTDMTMLIFVCRNFQTHIKTEILLFSNLLFSSFTL
jgi:hypothetical protein